MSRIVFCVRFMWPCQCLRSDERSLHTAAMRLQFHCCSLCLLCAHVHVCVCVSFCFPRCVQSLCAFQCSFAISLQLSAAFGTGESALISWRMDCIVANLFSIVSPCTQPHVGLVGVRAAEWCVCMSGIEPDSQPHSVRRRDRHGARLEREPSSSASRRYHPFIPEICARFHNTCDKPKC